MSEGPLTRYRCERAAVFTGVGLFFFTNIAEKITRGRLIGAHGKDMDFFQNGNQC